VVSCPDSSLPAGKPDVRLQPAWGVDHGCHNEGIQLYAWINPFRVDRLIKYRGYTLPVVRSLNGREMYLHPESRKVQEYVMEVIRDLLKVEVRTTLEARKKGWPQA